jgi:ABC-type phosphate transport system permease subunit
VAPLASHVSNHAKKFAHITVKELVVVFNYVLQILHTMLHRFHGLEAFIDRRVEIPDGLTTASSTTHWMQSEGVFIAIVSTVVTTVVAAAIVVAAAVGAFRSPLFGLLIPNVEVVIISSGGRSRARATIVSFDGVARC